MSANSEIKNFDPKSELDDSSYVTEPNLNPLPYNGPQEDDEFFQQNSEPYEEKEPLFVEDRTDNFRLSQDIQYDTHKSNSKNYSASRADSGPRQQNACWNCGLTTHSLHNCPKPRNFRKINQNRQAFLAQKQSNQQYFDNRGNRNMRSNRKTNRYFFQSNNSLCNNFTPGKLSSALLEALGVPENGIPVHIYKMRENGYPRAWIEEAKEEYSGISIFTAPNKCLPLPGMENGGNGFFCNINEKKLHEYPGYNVPSHPDAVDECKKYGCPEYNPEQSLKHMYKKLKSGKSILDCSGDYSSGEDTGFLSISNGTFTGEESLFSKVTEEDKSIIDRPPSSPEDGEITDDSMDENKEETPGNEIVSENVVDEQNNFDTSGNVVENKDNLNDDQSMTSENEIFSTPSTNLKRKFGDVKSEVLGTPVLKHFSSYENRPAHEHFAKGMVDLVDHENLPNSIGTFSKIKEILKDVRKTLNNLL